MSKKRKLDFDPTELVYDARKLFKEKSPNIELRPYTKYFADQKYKTIHIRKDENQSFTEIFGRILCDHEKCRPKAFQDRVSF